MKCKRCGTDEDRINGYCSVYCEDIADLEAEMGRLPRAVNALQVDVKEEQDLSALRLKRAEKAEAEVERLNLVLEGKENNFTDIAEEWSKEKDRAEKAEAELAACREENRRLREERNKYRTAYKNARHFKCEKEMAWNRLYEALSDIIDVWNDGGDDAGQRMYDMAEEALHPFEPDEG